MAPRSTDRQATPPSRQHRLAVSDSRQSRSPVVNQHSPSSASPASVRTPTDTSPIPVGKQSGPALLPRIRKQDQTLQPILVPQLPPHGTLPSFASSHPHGPSTSEQFHRRQTPPEGILLTPLSAVSSSSHDNRGNNLSSGFGVESHHDHRRPAPLPLVNTGVRSLPSISDALSPHHRQYTFQPYRPVHSGDAATVLSNLHDRCPRSGYPSTLWVPTTQGHQLPTITSPHSPLAQELLFHNYPEGTPATTLRSYLTAKIQPPSLVTRVPRTHANTGPFWWDVRNLRRWDSFNMQGIHKIPHFKKLLDLPLPEPSLPQPSAFHPQPESLLDLHNLYDRIFSVKVTEALKASTGVPHLVMSSQRPVDRPGAPLQVPDFIANYPPGMQPSDTDLPAIGSYTEQPCSSPSDNSAVEHHPRARVIGLVRPYSAWNSGMRAGGVTERTNYLRELSQLQDYMRDNRCRYGYIITEIELVCVRMGIRPSNEWPIFGLLELSEPIPLAAHAPSRAESECSGGHSRSRSSSGGSAHASRESKRLSGAAKCAEPEDEGTLTVALALWYLHMLAKQTPLPGQPSWKVHIGRLHELSRQHVVPRDKVFISDLNPHEKEKRLARDSRGYVALTY